MDIILSLSAGYLLGVCGALFLALILVLNENVRLRLRPIVNLVSLLPIIIYLPFLYLWFRFESGSLFWLILLGAFVPMLMNSLRGFIRINDFYFRSAKNLGADRYQLVSQVLLPGAASSLIRGLRIAWAISLVGLVIYQLLGYVAEFSVNDNYAKAFNDQHVLFTIFMIIAGGLIVDTCLLVLRRYLLVWDSEATA